MLALRVISVILLAITFASPAQADSDCVPSMIESSKVFSRAHSKNGQKVFDEGEAWPRIKGIAALGPTKRVFEEGRFIVVDGDFFGYQGFFKLDPTRPIQPSDGTQQHLDNHVKMRSKCGTCQGPYFTAIPGIYKFHRNRNGLTPKEDLLVLESMELQLDAERKFADLRFRKDGIDQVIQYQITWHSLPDPDEPCGCSFSGSSSPTTFAWLMLPLFGVSLRASRNRRSPKAKMRA